MPFAEDYPTTEPECGDVWCREQARELKIMMGYLSAGQFECGEIMVVKHVSK